MVAVASAKPQPLAPNLPSHRDPYYGGRWQKPKSPRYVDTISPGTGEPLGKVVDGSIRKQGDATLFRVRDRNGRASVPVRYVGAVPDPFRDGREVIVTVRKQGATFVGEKDSLVTKCPSKFTDQQQT